MQPHRGTLILVLGILGLDLCVPLGIAAWVMGNGDLKEIRGGRLDPAGEGMTNAGRIIGMIATILWLVGCGIYLVLIIMRLGMGAFRVGQ